MMGTKARIFTPIAVVSLEDLVTPTHFYRHLDRVLDLSFVRELVKTIYALDSTCVFFHINFTRVMVYYLHGLLSLLVAHGPG